MNEQDRLCDACGRPIGDDDPHFPHDPDCDHSEYGCSCDNETHEACCWECHPPQQSDPEPRLFSFWRSTATTVLADTLRELAEKRESLLGLIDVDELIDQLWREIQWRRQGDRV